MAQKEAQPMLQAANGMQDGPPHSEGGRGIINFGMEPHTYLGASRGNDRQPHPGAGCLMHL
jgi:hypothetical protein